MNAPAIFLTACRLIAKCSGVDLQSVEKAIEAVQSAKAYREIRVRKKSGKFRIIHAPCTELQIVQSGLLTFFYRWPVDSRMYGSVPKRSVIDNAQFHITVRNSNNPKAVYDNRVPRWVVRLDLKDAFPSVKRELLQAVYEGMFKSARLVGYQGLNEDDAGKVCSEFIRLLLELTTHNGVLPQGAPTSPYLLNLALCHTGMLTRIEQVCASRKKRRPFVFSVYVDDFIVSSMKDKISDLSVKKLIEAIEADGWFKVNREKTSRNSMRYKAHIVGGVVLTNDQKSFPRLTLSQQKLNSLRGKVHRLRLALEKYVLAAEQNNGTALYDWLDTEELMVVLGQISWVKSVYRGAAMPSSIRKEVELFEETARAARSQKRVEHHRQQENLRKFLMSSSFTAAELEALPD